MPTKSKAAATEEVDSSLADALEPEENADPLAATVEQITANIERARSLAEADNAEGLAELNKETEKLISSLPSRGKIGAQTAAKAKQQMRADFRAAASVQAPDDTEAKAQAQAQAKSAEVERKRAAEAEAEDYTRFEGVKLRVDAGADLVREGVQLHVKTAQTARRTAEMLLDAQRRVITRDGVPDLKCADPASIKARRDMYEAARKVLAAESGDAEHAKSLVDKFAQSVRNQMSDVLVGYVRELDKAPEEYTQFFASVAAAHPDLSPSEAVFTFYDIPRQSKKEIMQARQAAKSAKLAELEAAAQEGDAEAAEKVEELKAATVQERVASDVQRADDAIKDAIKRAAELSDEDKAALKSKLMEMLAVVAQL